MQRRPLRRVARIDGVGDLDHGLARVHHVAALKKSQRPAVDRALEDMSDRPPAGDLGDVLEERAEFLVRLGSIGEAETLGGLRCCPLGS